MVHDDTPLTAGRLLWRFMVVLSTSYCLGLLFYLFLRLALGDRIWWLSFLNEYAPVLFLPLLVITPAIWLLKARWLAIITLGLVLVAGVWFGRFFLPHSSPSPAGATLRVVTFNVWGYNAQLDQLEAWLQEVDADVVLLQEIPENYANEGIPALLDLYPFQHNQTTAEHWFANLFLSKFPILSAENLASPVQQRFTIDFHGRLVAIYNVHLSMPTGRSRLPFLTGNYVVQTTLSYDPRGRNDQIEEILAILETESNPYVVAGDFNMSEHAVTYGRIARQMHDAFREAGRGWGGSWPVSVVDGLPAFLPPLLRVDYIWYSSSWRAVEAERGPEMGSDHRPFWTDLELKEGEM